MYTWSIKRDNCPFPEVLEKYGSKWYTTIYHQFEQSGIPDNLIYAPITLKPETKGELEAYRELRKIQNNIAEFTDKGLNVFICGKTGTGKTSFGIKLLKEYIKTYYYIHPDDYGHPTVMYVGMPKLIQLFSINRYSIEFTELIRNMSECFLLLLDDVGYINLSQDFTMILYNIVQYRLENQLSTIYTSNVSGSLSDDENVETTSLYKKLGNDLLYSRTWGSCRPEHHILLTGRDRRGDK